MAGQLRGDWEEALRVAEAKVLRERAEHAAVTEALQSRLGGALAEAEVQRRACSEVCLGRGCMKPPLMRCPKAQRQAEAAQAGAAGAVGSVRRELEERCLQAEAARVAAEAASRTVTVERGARRRPCYVALRADHRYAARADRALAAAATHKADKEAAENALRSVSDNVTAREQLAEARAADAAQRIAEAGAKCAAAAAESAAAAADAAATAALQTAAQQAWSDARRTEEQWRARCSQLEAECVACYVRHNTWALTACLCATLRVRVCRRTQTGPAGTTVAVHAELVLPVCAPPIATDPALHGSHAPHSTLLSQAAPSLDAADADQRASVPLRPAGLVTRALRLLPGFGPRDSRAQKPAVAVAIPTAVVSASQEAAVVAGVAGQQLGAADRSTLDAHGDAVVVDEQERGSLSARSHGRSVANFSNKRPPPSVPAAAPSFQQSQRRSLRSSASPMPEKSGIASRGAKAIVPVKRKRGANSDDTGPAKSGCALLL